MPEIIVLVASSIYKDAYYADVVTSLGEVVSNDEPYCIIVPRVNELLIPPFFIFSERIHTSREWVIVRGALVSGSVSVVEGNPPYPGRNVRNRIEL